MLLPVEITFTIDDVPYLISRCFAFIDRKRILPAQKQPEQKTTVRATTALSTRHRVKLRRHETIHVATKKILSNNGML